LRFLTRDPPAACRARLAARHCTFAATDPLPLTVNVHVFVLLPPLEHAPDQIALRPFETLSVNDVPVLNDPEPELPTATLIPVGFDVTRSPLRPLALTVTVAVCVDPAGLSVSVALFVVFW
jgi:hypothetical protein